MFRSSISRLLIVVVLLALSVGTARASEDEAEALLTEGVALRRAHRDAEALALFERAFKASPSARARAQMGMAEQALNRWLDAEEHVKAALAAADDPWVVKSRPALLEAAELIADRLAWVTVVCDRRGAEILIGGRVVGTSPLAAPVRVVAGRVYVEVRGERIIRQTAARDVLPRSQNTITLKLADAASPAPVTVALPPERPSPIGGYLALGGGAVALSVGGVFGVLALNEKSERDAGCDDSGCTPAAIDAHRAARTDAWVSTVAFGVGIVAVAAGVYLVLSARRPAATAFVGPPTFRF